MGKKRVATQTKDQLIKEIESIQAKIQRELRLKGKKQVEEAKIYIFSSYNNTILTLTDVKGNVIYWTSAGRVGFQGTKKGTPYAASKAAEVMAEVVKQLNIPKIHVLVKGVGSGRDAALRTLGAHELNIISIKDVTPIPHDGCRPPKVRRV
jgi:small subunit ribosomal protein S11